MDYHSPGKEEVSMPPRKRVTVAESATRSPTIELSRFPGSEERLHEKLAEYKNNMFFESKALAAQGVPVLERPGYTLEIRYKIEALRELLATGRLDYDAFLQKQSKGKGLDMTYFKNAFDEVKAVCENSDENIH